MRTKTTVPQQALWFFNNPFIHSAVNRIASRPEMSEGNAQERATFLFLLLFSRGPEPTELSAIEAFLSNNNSDQGLKDLIHVLLMSNEFVYIN